MRKLIISLFISIIFISLVGCNSKLDINVQVNETNTKAEVEKLLIEKRVGTDNQYERFKEISDKEKVETCLDILQNADWENAKVLMAHPPDFKMNNKYLIWLSPEKNYLEVINQDKHKYTKISNRDSEVLFEIITDEKLGE